MAKACKTGLVFAGEPNLHTNERGLLTSSREPLSSSFSFGSRRTSKKLNKGRWNPIKVLIGFAWVDSSVTERILAQTLFFEWKITLETSQTQANHLTGLNSQLRLYKLILRKVTTWYASKWKICPLKLQTRIPSIWTMPISQHVRLKTIQVSAFQHFQ